MTPNRGDVGIALLGGFRVSTPAVTVDEDRWPSRRSAELVQLLALAERRQLQRDEVIEALWPHLDPQAGAANLRKAAHHARQVLGDPDAVVLRGGSVALFPGRAVTTDLNDLERLVGRAAHGDPDVPGAAATAPRGELLPGSRYEEWTQAPRERARRLQVDLALATGDWERVVELEPTHEEAHRELMRAALDAGARASALRWYERLRTALATELGVGPEPETDALRDRCVEGLAVGPVDLVGRPETVVVTGPAGIGKTALGRELARAVEVEGRRVWTVAVTGDDRAYGGVVDLVAEVLGREGASVLQELGGNGHPVLAALTDLAAPAPVLEGPVSRHQVVGALQGLLRAASSGRPSVVVVDDAHRADEATLDVLGHLASTGRGAVVVLAHRRRCRGSSTA